MIECTEGKLLPAWVNFEIAQLYVHWMNSREYKSRILKDEEFDSLMSTLKSTKGNTNFKHYNEMPVGFLNDDSLDGIYELIGNR